MRELWTGGDIPFTAAEIKERVAKAAKYTELGHVEQAIVEKIPLAGGINEENSTGDRLFLMRQTREPPGIVAAGSVTSLPQEVPHWVPERRALGHTAITVGANWDQFFADPVVVDNSLDTSLNALVPWKSRRSGVSISDELGDFLWNEFFSRLKLPAPPFADEIGSGSLKERAIRQVIVNTYERNLKARQVCLNKCGYKCSCCILLSDVYGHAADQLIQVHHLLEVSIPRQSRGL